MYTILIILACFVLMPVLAGIFVSLLTLFGTTVVFIFHVFLGILVQPFKFLVPKADK